MRIQLVQGDLTTYRGDAIVNAANESLLGGGGVDGAIHRAAGAGLLEETKTLGGCPTGEARLSGAHDLPLRGIIHTVGPIWQGGGQGEKELLQSAYKSAMRLAKCEGYKEIAFPSISTGVYAFPIAKAAEIALGTIATLQEDEAMPDVVFYLFSAADLAVYEEALAILKSK